ncbi:hypothetical protein [Corynebacterium tuberculostearicum]|uniref:hypothetical protein n=1 Tax=Corynebacterium tuberculostearicum TaxID=38304 RepID=UPI002026175F|nr:hypothetical protein [Corynebacterium tuberculostearicum]MCG7455603.1 hypothetical protein [Corynebacterium tuberculostearicum]
MQYSEEFVQHASRIGLPGVVVEWVSLDGGVQGVNVLKVSNLMSLNRLIALWRHRIRGRTFFRGQRNLYQKVPLSGKERFDACIDRESQVKPVRETSLEMFLQFPGFGEMKTFGRGNSKDFVWEQFKQWETETEPFIGFSRQGSVPAYALEGICQHYLGGTTWLDVVDNPLVALWMSTRSYSSPELNMHGPVIRVEPIEGASSGGVFLYLYGQPDFKKVHTGLYESEDSYLLDLREMLVAEFLRPHAQGGMLLKNKKNDECLEKPTKVVAIKLDPNSALAAVGNSQLLNVESLFPSAGNDLGFNMLRGLFNFYWQMGMTDSGEQRKHYAEFFPPAYVE